MPEPAAAIKPDEPETKSVDSSIRKAGPTSVIIRPVPNILFLWPSMVAGVISGLLMSVFPASERVGHQAALIYFVPLIFNFMVITFSFSRTKIVTIFFAVLAFVLAISYAQWWSAIASWFTPLNARANSHFYFVYSLALGVIYAIIYVSTRFDYWEITNNELIHHHGFLGDVERFPAPNLRISKEIDDVFQWLLMGSGRLIFYPSDQHRAIILDNVVGINRVENRIKELLSTLSVTMYHKN